MKFSKNKIFITIIVALVIVAAAVWYFGVLSIKPEKSTTVQQTTSAKKQVAKEPESKFATLKGDAFDEAFIADMLAHHEGAVNMSEQAQAVTAHEEIRTLAGQITETQSLEMMQMREWQKAWGFKVTNSGGHMSHGGGGAAMAGDMVEMMAKLQNLTGEAYDKEFLKQMIVHHEQAIEMAKYASANAKRQEVKTLASNIISAQKAEISDMKAWQKEWGYES